MVLSFSGPCKKKRRCGGRNRQQKENSKRKRKRTKCRLENCHSEVTDIMRHFRQVHPEIPLTEVLQMFSRKKKTSERPKYSWKCQHCSWSGDRLDTHLRRKHFLSCDDARKEFAEIKEKEGKKSNSTHSKFYPAQEKTNSTNITNQFHAWLDSFAGGFKIPDQLPEHDKKKKEATLKSYANKIKTILDLQFGQESFKTERLSELADIGEGNPSIVDQLHESGNRAWGTVKNYLHILTHFCKFLTKHYRNYVNQEKITEIQIGISACIKSVSRYADTEKMKKRLEDRKKILDWSNVINYFEKEYARKYMLEFDQCQDEERKKHLASKVQQHLLLQISFYNGKRTGIYESFNLREFQNAQEVEGTSSRQPEGEGSRVSLVAEGKTFRCSGAAGLHFKEEEYEILNNYVNKVRPMFNPKTEQVFCRASGERSTGDAGDINKMNNSAWLEFCESTNTTHTPVTSSLIRKSLITTSRNLGLSRDNQIIMAPHMDHSIDTADKYYNVSAGVLNTVRFRKIIETFSRHDEDYNNEPSSDEEEDLEEDDIPLADNTNISESSSSAFPISESNPLSKRASSQNPSNANMIKLQLQPKKKRKDAGQARERVFSEEDSQRLLRCCNFIIEKDVSGRKIVTKKIICDEIRRAGPNFRYLLQNYKDSQLVTKVRTECKRLKKLHQTL